jgi:hypothetical protein
MKELVNAQIINEDDRSYTISLNGIVTRYIKINPEELKIAHLRDLELASQYISERNFGIAIFLVNGFLKYPPTVDVYEESATNVVNILERFHYDLKPHGLTHLVHSLIKNISVETYGKAQTFLHYLRLWNQDLKVIKVFKDGNS